MSADVEQSPASDRRRPAARRRVVAAARAELELTDARFADPPFANVFSSKTATSHRSGRRGGSPFPFPPCAVRGIPSGAVAGHFWRSEPSCGQLAGAVVPALATTCRRMAEAAVGIR